MTTTDRTANRIAALHRALSLQNAPQTISALLFDVNWPLDLDEMFPSADSLRRFIRQHLPDDCITKQGGALLISLREFAQPDEIAAVLREFEADVIPLWLNERTRAEICRDLWLNPATVSLYQSMRWAEQSGVIEHVYGGGYGEMVRLTRTTAPAWVSVATGTAHNAEVEDALGITHADHVHALRDHVILNETLAGISYKAGRLNDGRVLVQRIDRHSDIFKYALMARSDFGIWKDARKRGETDPETGRIFAA